ncbi:hypothetical protein EDD85DRAFT_795518 [Armillaria nabsnona]|nr:hypothetical protein EDD85DRAFT_795518 [Armillaria nabsnona]
MPTPSKLANALPHIIQHIVGIVYSVECQFAGIGHQQPPPKFALQAISIRAQNIIWNTSWGAVLTLKDHDRPMLSEQESLASLDLTELFQAYKHAENYQQNLYGLQNKLKCSQKRVKIQAENLGKKATYIEDLEDEIAHLMKESEVMMSKMTLQAEGRVENRKQLHNLKAKIKWVPNCIANATKNTTVDSPSPVEEPWYYF